ncbi:MAG: VCBS repeat-containing protein [Bacteroidetes bacterium]|nr:VCBS repeat-containing protein [Bacteroidota bacterium]
MRKYLRLALALIPVSAVCLGTVAAQPAQKLFELLPPSKTGIHFANNITESEQYNGVSYTNAYNGSGVAAGDVNGDGLVDLFFTGTQVTNRLYINKGNWQFEDVTVKAGVADSAGVGRGAVMVDIDGDGDLDIYVCRISHPNRLYINNGDGTFTDRAKEYGLDFSGHSVQAAFLDYDGDGDLDMYLTLTGAGLGEYYARYGQNDRLFRNNGDGTFTDVTKEAGIVDQGYGMNVLATDINDDGWPDIYVSNDFEEQDKVYLNNRNGTFTNIRGRVIRHMSHSSMGCDAADFNNDGHIDIVTLDMLARDHTREMKLSATLSVLSPIFDSAQVPRNTLQLNRGNGLFSDIAGIAGVDATDWSWPALFADYDLDGYKDLFIGNGMKRDMTDRDASYRVVPGTTKMDLIKLFPQNPLSSFCFRNNHDLTFSDSSSAWGFGGKYFSFGAVYADLDNDGDLDLVVNTEDTTALVYRNNAVEQHRGHYLQIQLDGTGKNRFGLGARVELRTDGKYQMLEQSPVRGYLGCVEPRLHFGLGADTVVGELKVRWPGGKVQRLYNVHADQVITLHARDAVADTAKPVSPPTPIFTMLDPSKCVAYSHQENLYDDLKRERLLPRRMSENGPGMAVGDVNGDGLEDIYVGGAADYKGHILLQNPNGKFTLSADSAVIGRDSASEDMGALFFDADGDGDLDLYVVSGGSEFDNYSPDLQDRLYINDGKGHFTKSSGAIPAETTSGSCVVAADYDGDGDLDLFVGGRLVPGHYPLPAASAILRNDGGKFTDVTSQVCPALSKLGLVCSTIWTDFDNDGKLDLITTGEWMPVRFFHNDGDHFTELHNTGVDSIRGWWNSIAAGDFDNDGDMDYIIGNVGDNWRYKPSQDAPLKLYAADFDGNGSIDPLITYYDRAYKKEFPMFDRLRLNSHMPKIQGMFKTFSQFASATINDIIPRAKLDTAYTLSATEFRSCYLENLGNGKFAMHLLPQIAQISPVFGIAVEDYDGDGNLDAILTGNFFDGPEPTVVRYDASWGLVLKGDGKGNFTPLSLEQSGMVVNGDSRGVGLLRLGKGVSTRLCAMVVNNSGPLQAFQVDVAANKGKLWTLDRGMHATHAIITLKDGRKRRFEFQTGSGYLTQSSPTLIVTPSFESMTVYNGNTVVKEVKF